MSALRRLHGKTARILSRRSDKRSFARCLIRKTGAETMAKLSFLCVIRVLRVVELTKLMKAAEKNEKMDCIPNGITFYLKKNFAIWATLAGVVVKHWSRCYILYISHGPSYVWISEATTSIRFWWFLWFIKPILDFDMAKWNCIKLEFLWCFDTSHSNRIRRCIVKMNRMNNYYRHVDTRFGRVDCGAPNQLHVWKNVNLSRSQLLY